MLKFGLAVYLGYNVMLIGLCFFLIGRRVKLDRERRVMLMAMASEKM